jgi:hypothetical protein
MGDIPHVYDISGTSNQGHVEGFKPAGSDAGVPGVSAVPDPPHPPSPPPPKPPTRAEIERIIGTSGTILGKTIPMCYGTKTLVGHIGAWEYSSPNLDLGIIFAFGEQNSIATGTTKINGEVITSATGISNESVHVGDGTTAISAILTGMTAWTADDTTKWKNYAHAVMRIDCKRAKLPGSFTFTSKLGGRKVTPIGGGAAAVSENLAVIGYDVMTSSDWAGVATTKINETSWGLFEDWCNEVMADASKRYEFNGAIHERNPDKALAEVLGHGLGKPYIDTDGKLAIWGEMAPAHITGDWSASASATITEDASGGAATTELAVDDYVYVDTNLRRVSSITDDDTVVLDSAVTVSGVRVRPISNVYVKKHQWVFPPAASESSLLQTPDKYRVRFEDEDNLGSHEVTSTYGAGTDKIIEAYLPGCASAGVAARHAETTLKVAHLQPFYWSGVVANNIGTQLEPGDVLLFDDDMLTMQPARVLPPIQARADGTYLLTLREYDPAAYSDSTDTTDTVPNLGTGFASNVAPVMTYISTVYSSTTYSLIGMGTSGIYQGRVTVGDTGRETVLGSNDVRLPNNVPYYALTTGGTAVGLLKMNTSNEIQLGDGSYNIFLNSPDLILVDDGSITGGHASPVQLLKWETTPSNAVKVGNTTYDTLIYANSGVSIEGNLTIKGGSLYSTFKGCWSKSTGVLTTTELPSSKDWGICYNSTTPGVGLFFNWSGTIYRFT